jgi:Holliday junction resolvase
VTEPKTPAGLSRGEATGARRANQYRRGKAFQNRIRHDLIDNGYRIIESAGSKGKIDIIAGKPGQRLAIQCKIRGALGTDEWNQLLAWARDFDAVPILAVGGRGVRYWYLAGPKTVRGVRPMVPFAIDFAA